MTIKRHQGPESGSGPVQLSCKECCQTIPYSRESEDYVAYFCGLECYQKWKENTHLSDNANPQARVLIGDNIDKTQEEPAQ